MSEQSPNVVESPVTKFAARLQDPSQWRIIKDVPIFDEHEEVYPEMVQGPDGRKVRQNRVERFGLAELQAHADRCNQLVANGNPPGLTLGHTKDDAPENQQPETVGVGVNYRVRYDSTLGKNVITYDEYYLPEKYEQVKTYPYRSVERWRKGGYFKPIALLRREPRRNLGVVLAYQAKSQGELCRYSVSPCEVNDESSLFGNDVVLRYSMEYTMPHNQPDAAMPPAAAAPPPAMSSPVPPVQNAAPAAPAAPGQMMEPSDKDKELFQQLCKYFKVNYEAPQAAAAPASPTPGIGGPQSMPPAGNTPPVETYYPKGGHISGKNLPGQAAAIGAKKADPYGDYGDDDEDYAAGGSAASPSASNTAIPPATTNKVMPMSADTTDVERYHRMESVIRSQNDRIAELEKGERIARYAAAFGKLESEGWPIDSAEEVVRCQDYSQAEFDQHIADIKKYGAKTRLPVGSGVRPDGSPQPMNFGGAQRRMSPEEFDTAMQYMQENPGKTHTEAIKYAMNGAPVRN